MQRTRTELKGFFKKLAIPTESNFADLIESTFNQSEDSIFKPPHDPLSIRAVGNEEGLIHFYREEQNANTLTWRVTQKPTGATSPGLSIHEAGGPSRLFIQSGTGNVGIGTPTPVAKLEVAGNIVGTNVSVAPTNDQRGAYFLATRGDFNHAIYNNYSNIDGEGQWDGSKWNCFAGLNVRVGSGTKKSSAFYIKSDGNVGIGTTDPKAPLHVATRSAVIGGSNFRSGAGNTQYWSIGCWEWVGAQGFKSWSDARVKMNPQKLDTQEALCLINKLNLVDFEHIPTYHSGQKGRGVYAQEIQDLLPDAVSAFPEMELDDGTVLQDFLSVDYDWIFVTGMAALQELSKQNQALQQTVAELKTEMRRLHKNGRVSA